MKGYFYLKQNGRSPLEEYLKTVKEKRELARIKKLIDKCIERGGKLPEPHAKHIVSKIWELRSFGGSRIFYTVQAEKVIFFFGYMKKRGKLPRTVVAKALDYFEDYLTFKKAKIYD